MHESLESLSTSCDVLSLLLILAFSIFAFGLMASVLAQDQEVTQSWTMAFLLLTGSFDDSDFNVMEWLVFMGSCIFNVIIVFNLFIAILNDVYADA